MNYFNKIVGGMTAPAPNQEDIKVELEKRKKQVVTLTEKLKKANEEKEFMGKSYEELEKKYEAVVSIQSAESAANSKNLETFAANLQNIPDHVLEGIVSSLLEKVSQNLGEGVGESEVRSVLELDCNYKATFSEYVRGVYEATRQQIRAQTSGLE